MWKRKKGEGGVEKVEGRRCYLDHLEAEIDLLIHLAELFAEVIEEILGDVFSGVLLVDNFLRDKEGDRFLFEKENEEEEGGRAGGMGRRRRKNHTLTR